MQNDYLGFLDQRNAQRRLLAKFSHPRLLLLHTIAFVGAVTLLWAWMIPWLGSLPPFWFRNPSLAFFAWSFLLAGHALLHYRRSSAVGERRELAVEAAMREFIEKNPQQVDDTDLFAMHQDLSSSLERLGWLTQALAAFALVNLASWIGSVIDNVGSSWGYQLTLPIALVLVGGIYGFKVWQHHRQSGRGSWFTRLPLHHILAYVIGTPILAILGAYRMVNYWDVNTLVGWWTLALLIHVVWSVLLQPLLDRVLPEKGRQAFHFKRKPAERLVLADDGEIVPLDEVDSAQYQTKSR